MDAADKIRVFNDLESLENAIRQDVDSRDILAQRYCVRFIMLNNFEVFRGLTRFLYQEIGVELLDLSNHTFGEDKTMTIDTLCDIVKSIDKTTLLTPFSELVRFFKEVDFNGFFNDIILNESIRNPRKRIYIPIIGLHNRFTDFLKNFGRIDESAPVWQYYTPKDDKVMVYVSKYCKYKLPEHQNICSLPTMRDWLTFWKKQAPKDKILCGASPIVNGYINSKPDSIFTFSQINNAYEFISEFLEINLPIAYDAADDAHWDKLLEGIDKMGHSGFSYKRYVCDLFNKKSIDVEDIITLWADDETTEYGRWLLRNLALSFNYFDDTSYVKLCITETTQLNVPNALFESIAEQIFFAKSQAEFEKSYEQRRNVMSKEPELFRKLVSSDKQNWIKSKIIEIAQNDNALSTATKYCSGVFDFERGLFLGWYLKRTDFGDAQLKQFFPDLVDYMLPQSKSVKAPKDWVVDYMSAFRRAKMSDTYNDDIKNAIAQYNKNEDSFYEWYYAFKESHELLQIVKADSLKAPDKIYWVDGLGAEFMPFIIKQIEKSNLGYSAIHAEMARTTIPSNTHLNSFEVDNISTFKIADLDELAHSGHYVKYSTFIEELATVKSIIERILNGNKVGTHTIAIVSDHGLSTLSRLCPSKKLTGKSKHEGRYIPITDKSETFSETDYVVHTNERDGNKYKVALTHSSLGIVPTHEVHGGCTPEEVVVPFIIISNNEAAKPISYNVTIISDSVAVSDGTLSFTINPEPKNAVITIDAAEHKLEYSNLKWTFKAKYISEGNHKVCVIPHKGAAYEFTVNFYGMGFGNSLTDFDD